MLTRGRKGMSVRSASPAPPSFLTETTRRSLRSSSRRSDDSFSALYVRSMISPVVVPILQVNSATVVGFPQGSPIRARIARNRALGLVSLLVAPIVRSLSFFRLTVVV